MLAHDAVGAERLGAGSPELGLRACTNVPGAARRAGRVPGNRDQVEGGGAAHRLARDTGERAAAAAEAGLALLRACAAVAAVTARAGRVQRNRRVRDRSVCSSFQVDAAAPPGEAALTAL